MKHILATLAFYASSLGWQRVQEMHGKVWRGIRKEMIVTGVSICKPRGFWRINWNGTAKLLARK